jgi:putative transposase
MKVTLKLRLHLSPEAEALLLDTLRQATASFNAVTTHGWKTGQRNGTRLHHATYHALREAYPDLPSQLHCAARVKALEALKSTDQRRKQGCKVSCPTSRLCPARYDARSYRVKLAEGIASLATTGGRVCVQFNVCRYYRRYLPWKPCSADLCYDGKNGTFSLHVVVEAPAPELVHEGVIGVDLGITEIATDSAGNQYSGEPVKAVRRRVRRIRRLLQSKGTKSAKRHLKRLRQKQSRFTKNTNHVLSKRLVATASTSRKALALEDLSGIRDRAETVFSREMRWLMGNWAFDQLRRFVSYKAEAAGVPVVLVDPRNTSRTCSQCGYCDKGNRKSQDRFLCLHCGFALNADVNAAINIGARAASSDGLLCRSKGSPNDQAQAPCL